MFCLSDLVGDMPHTVQCNAKEMITQLNVCPLELAGDYEVPLPPKFSPKIL